MPGLYAGCPARKVDRIERVPGGAFLYLECGHAQWYGGWDWTPSGPVVRPCLQGPCYRLERGKDPA